MSGPYILGDVLEEAREAMRSGQTIENIAGRLRCDVSYLQMLLGIRHTESVAATDANCDADLWAVDRLANRL